MTEAEACRIRRRAITTARSLGRHAEAENFAHFAVMAFMNGRKPGYYKELFWDYWRHIKGRPGNKKRIPDSALVSYDLVPEPPASPTGEMVELPLADLWDGSQRAMIILRGTFGLTLKEIGIVFGVSESRVCQLFSEIEKKAKS